MTTDARAELAALLRQVRARLTDSPDEAAECDALLRDLESREDRRLREVASLFLPTGSLQDLAIGSGWGDEFCAIADRVDLLLPRLDQA